MTNKDISKIIIKLRRAYKNFTRPSVTEISDNYKDPFLILISCILSLRTKDKISRLASERLFSLAKSPKQILKLSLAKIRKLIYPVGFYRIKSIRIREICSDLIKRFDGKVPDNLEDLLSLKGVGRKTANLVLTLGFGKLGICVDTHVHRISNRLNIVDTANPLQTELELRKILPQKYWLEYNDLLVTFGQNICKPISPLCSKCTIRSYCHKKAVKFYR